MGFGRRRIRVRPFPASFPEQRGGGRGSGRPGCNRGRARCRGGAGKYPADRTADDHAAAAVHDRAGAAAADLGRRPGHGCHRVLVRAGHCATARADADVRHEADHRGPPGPDYQPARAGLAGRDAATPACVVDQLHRRAEQPDDVLLPRGAQGPRARNAVLLPDQTPPWAVLAQAAPDCPARPVCRAVRRFCPARPARLAHFGPSASVPSVPSERRSPHSERRPAPRTSPTGQVRWCRWCRWSRSSPH